MPGSPETRKDYLAGKRIPHPVDELCENGAGGTLENGDVVVLDYAEQDAAHGAKMVVTTTATANDTGVVGVVVGASGETFADGMNVVVRRFGYHPAVKVNGAVSAGDQLTTKDSAGRAQSGTAGAGKVLGLAIGENTTGDGTLAAFIDPK